MKKEIDHDPSEYIRNLQQLLVSDKKKIGFLFGAGTSLVINPKTHNSYVPAIGKMTELIEKEIGQEEKYSIAIKQIKQEIENDKIAYTIESFLSKLELKKQVIGSERLNGLKKKDIEDLIKKIKKQIQNLVGIEKDIDAKELIHSHFAEWIGKADRKSAIEIFTTNYDYLFEVAFEHKSIPYYDGFTGSYQPFFNGESVDDLAFLPNQTKLWKIHGSLGWHYDENLKRVLRKDSDSNDILIYPSTLKYDQSRKQPYTALGDRLTNFIKQPDTVLIICGYSFGDDHINERINTALSSNQLGHIYVLFYDIKNNSEGKKIYTLTETCDVAKTAIANSKISIFGSRSAIIGGVYGKWKLKREPSKEDSINIDTYFDEDTHTSITDKIKEKISQGWTGEGELTLPDFSKFTSFLESMIFSQDETN